MNKHTNIYAILAFFILTVSCTPFKKATVTDSDLEKQGFVKALVITMELDGCTYMLQQEADKKNLEPDGLSPEFQHDSMKVWIKYTAEDRMSVCMAGETIKLIEIKRR